VLLTDDERDFDRVREPYVQAVVWRPRELPDWLRVLGAAVGDESFRMPRTVLEGVTAEDLATWLDANLPFDAVAPDVRAALAADVLRLAERVLAMTEASRFMLRILTDTPNRRCGFHVDTVAPGASPWGLLRVYNGAGTAYADPTAVTAMTDFYRYLARRERLVRDLDEARQIMAAGEVTRLHAELEQLDEELAFLTHRDRISIAPAGSIVAFKHLDLQRLWSDHPSHLAWIHCSPMAGRPRLVVNLTARGRLRRPARQVVGATVP
jgi:hypothetical protein